jgi:PAS domain S-box-containing protein
MTSIPVTADDLFEAIADPAFTLNCDADGELRYGRLNAAHVAAVGIPSDQVAGKTPHECFPARLADTLLENYLTCARSCRPYRYEEVLELGGREIWWETTLSPLRDPGGTITGILGVAVDITERKTREVEAANAFSDLQQLNRDIMLFGSMTAHDVRGPLKKIDTLIATILDDFDDLGDGKLEYVTMVGRVARQAVEYVEDILTHAKGLEMRASGIRTVDISHICRDIAALTDPEARLDISAPHVSIECESTVLQLILRNLIENASRHAQGRITLLADIADNRPGFVRFTVADDGRGFPGGAEGFESRIHMKKRDTGNRGFGLAAVAHLVEGRGGRIGLGPTPFGKGCAIGFDLPGRILENQDGLVALAG